MLRINDPREVEMARIRLFGAFLACAILLATPALAVDGVVLINHAAALAGNVTPGDTPGYPVTLSRPGSYRLSGNLSPPANANGIDATAGEVTIDFNGFRMQGSPKADIGVFGAQRGLVVRNGTIRGFLRYGISANGANAIIEDMSISANGSSGIYVPNAFARIVNNTITDNTGAGIFCLFSCHVEGNYIAANGSGVRIYIGTVLGNTIHGNTGAGIYGNGIPGFNAVGFGNNTIVSNGVSVSGIGFLPLHPNFCAPVC